MNIHSYLKRIQYQAETTPSIDLLTKLQKAHVLNIPFENLAIHYNQIISLEESKIFNKVVENKRGGFCYELNNLYFHLLEKLGFNVKRISARVYNSKENIFGEEFDHMALIVKIDHNEYLTDVGFGEFAFHPLKIELNEIQIDPRGKYVIEKHENGYYKISSINNGEKQIEYIFTLQRRNIEDFYKMCSYHQTSSKSHFTQKRLISKPTANGRITISGNTLKITKSNKVIKEDEITTEIQFMKHLSTYFEIDRL